MSGTSWVQILSLQIISLFPCGSVGKESACSAGDAGSVPGLGRAPGEGNDYLLHYSCLENSMNRGTWQAIFHGITKSWTRLSDWTESMGFTGGLDSKESACNAGDLCSIPGSGKSPGEGNGNPLQYSCLENPMDRGAWRVTVRGVANSQTWLND